MINKRLLLFISLVFTLSFNYSPTSAQSAETIKQFLKDKHLQNKYRDGGPYYGTYYTRDIFLCQSGVYIEKGYSEKRTILENTQKNNWTSSGYWTIIEVYDQVILQTSDRFGNVNGQVGIVSISTSNIITTAGQTIGIKGHYSCQ